MQYPAQPLEMDFAKGDINDAYQLLFQSLSGGGEQCTLSFEQFKNGYTFFCVDLSPDGSGSAGKNRELLKMLRFIVSFL